MTTSKDVNYFNYFEHKDLTKIHGEPTYDTIKLLHDQIKANAASVRSSLGGGLYGHLGLVLSPTEYAMVSNTPFDRPNHPGVLVIPQGTLLHAANTMKEAHAEALRLFNEVLGVDNALRQQIVGAIEPKYLKSLRNVHTKSITMPVYDIFVRHLYPIYGNVSTDSLRAESRRVEDMTYDVTCPPDDVYVAIEELMALASAANNGITQRQAVSMGFDIMKKQPAFRANVRDWVNKPPIQQTWINFKQHFNQAYKEVKKIGDTTIGESIPYQQANVIQQMVANAVQDTLQQYLPPPDENEINEEDNQDQAPPPEQQANTGRFQQQDPMLPMLMQQMQQMQEMMKMMQSNMASNSNNFNGGGYNNNGNGNGNGNGTGYGNYNNGSSQYGNGKPSGDRRPRDKKYGNKYCWTHGCGRHSGKECTRKAQGHNEATFKNRMNGSNKYCRRNKNNNK